jgi:benzoyl-CoA reductase/2-hydroxyglutaryl-CoA dehydratase subunit BcrC/BadD/HgdB
LTQQEPTKDRIEALIRTCRMVSRMNRNRPDTMKSELLYYQMLDKYFSRVLRAKQEGGFLAAHTVFFPVEILYAMGITPLHNEVCTWTLALLLGNQTEFLNAGAEVGLASEICTAHRGLAGAYHLGAMPRPDVVLWSSLICDNSAKCGELLMDMNHCPGFFLDRPFGGDPSQVQYLINEYKDMIAFLEKQSGRKLDWDRLSQSVSEMDKQIRLHVEIGELRKAVPSPLSGRHFLEFLTVDYMFAGQPEGTEYLETMRDELAEKVRLGQGAVKAERFRLMSFFVPPIYLISFLDQIAQEFGAVTVTEPLFTYWKYQALDPSKPLESCAQKSYMIPESRTMYGLLSQETMQDVKDCARDYRVNGAIYYAFLGCRHTCAMVKVFKDILYELDIPLLTLDCDIMDPTINSQPEVRQKMEQFFELLEDR